MIHSQQRQPTSRSHAAHRLTAPPPQPTSTRRSSHVERISSADEAGPFLVEEEEEEAPDDVWPPRMPASARRYAQASTKTTTPYQYQFHAEQVQHIPTRSSARRVTEAHPPVTAPRIKSRPRLQWFWFILLGGATFFILWLGASWASVWWTNTHNDWTYTAAFRTASLDQAVGHNGDSAAHPSHFIVQNDHQHIIVIELPANDASKAIIYTGPFLIGDGQDQLPVTISFQPNNHTGRLDLVLHIQDQAYVFLNTGTRFVAAPAP